MPIRSLTTKDVRTITLDLSTLFAVRGFQANLTFEQVQRLGMFHPWLERSDGNSLPLSDWGISALKRIRKMVKFLPAFQDCSEQELESAIFSELTSWHNRLLQPDGIEFVSGLTEILSAGMKQRTFILPVSGIELEPDQTVSIGSVELTLPSQDLLATINLGGALTPEWVYERLDRGIWLRGSTYGSPDVSRSRFEHKALLITGLLGVYASIIYDGAIHRTRIKLGGGSKASGFGLPILRCEDGGENPTMMFTNRQSSQRIPFDAATFDYLKKECFWDDFGAVLDAEDRTELQDSIVRALYWFADAHADLNSTMQFVKLWSCAECFFSIENEGITELLTRGIAVVLAFAGYQIVTLQEYPSFKRRLKSLYALRSRSIHRAEFGIVTTKDLAEFSRWIGWLIVSMAALAGRGYEDLKKG